MILFFGYRWFFNRILYNRQYRWMVIMRFFYWLELRWFEMVDWTSLMLFLLKCNFSFSNQNPLPFPLFPFWIEKVINSLNSDTVKFISLIELEWTLLIWWFIITSLRRFRLHSVEYRKESLSTKNIEYRFLRISLWLSIRLLSNGSWE